MFCSVHRSRKRADTYLFVCQQETTFEAVPELLLRSLQPMEHVMDLVLHPQRTLVREPALKVMRNLLEQGWHLQLPPNDEPERAGPVKIPD